MGMARLAVFFILGIKNDVSGIKLEWLLTLKKIASYAHKVRSYSTSKKRTTYY